MITPPQVDKYFNRRVGTLFSIHLRYFLCVEKTASVYCFTNSIIAAVFFVYGKNCSHAFFPESSVAVSLVYGKSRLCFFGQYAAAAVSLAYGKTSYLRIESARYTTVSLAYGKIPSVDAVRFPSQEFPFQRPLPCIARSCIVSTGV